MKHLLTELDRLYEADIEGQWSGEAAADIVNELSERVAAAGLSHLVRAPLPECDVVDAKRYVSMVIRDTAQDEPIAAMQADLLNPKDVAKLFSVSPATVMGWIRTGQLKASNLASGNRPRYVIQRDEVNAFLKMRQPEPPRKRSKRNRAP